MKNKLELPYYSGDKLWEELTTDRVGFFTSRTKHSIPNASGVYAWVLPLELKKETAVNFIERYKTILSYDSKKKDVFFERSNLNYQWQTFQLTLEAKSNYSKEKTQEESWDFLQNNLESAELKSLRQIILLGSIFTKPLYVGLTKNLNSRYEQHVSNTEKNSFYKRFQDFSEEKSLGLSVSDLMFTCVPLPLGNDTETVSKELRVLEYFLKNITGPIFGEI